MKLENWDKAVKLVAEHEELEKFYVVDDGSVVICAKSDRWGKQVSLYYIDAQKIVKVHLDALKSELADLEKEIEKL